MSVPPSQDGRYKYVDAMKWYWIDYRHIAEGLEASERAGLDGARITELPYGKTAKQVDLSPLAGRRWLRRLGLEFEYAKVAPNVIGAEVLGQLPNLEELWLEKFDVDLTALSRLRSLYLTELNSSRLPVALGASPYQHISVAQHRAPDLRGFVQCPRLESLYLAVSSIESLEGLESLTELRELRISRALKLHDVSALAHTKRLEFLHLEKCKRVRDYSVLEGHPSLKKLFVSQVPSLGFVPKVPKLEEIFFWNCEDGNLHPLLESPRLSRIMFSKDLKHYTHKMDEIERSLKGRVTCLGS